jgi:tRNA-modifying protein YgfZ
MSNRTDMIRFDTPLRRRHEEYVEQLVGRPSIAAEELRRPGAATGERIAPPEIEYLPYGPRDESGSVQCEIIGTFGEVQAEYAAIRNGAALVDSPHRGVIRVTGSDRISFLNSMLTAELKNLAAGGVRQAFWLNRKGRIEADLMIAAFGEQMLIDVDVHALQRTISSLESFLFSEDVAMADAHGDFCRFTIHGTRAIDVIRHAGSDESFMLEHLHAAMVTIAEHDVHIARSDQTGEVGLHLFVPRDRAGDVWDALLATDEQISGGKRRVRPIGWHAFNIARIEAGTPLLNIDFGTDNLPHETGILNQRVSFTKGCFLGQEVVARMQHLGRPKIMLVGLQMEDDLLPIEGTPVFAADEANSDGKLKANEQVGVITSSTLSPLLGARPVAFAMLRSKEAQSDRRVVVEVEGRIGTAIVGELRSIKRPGEQAANGATSLPRNS